MYFLIAFLLVGVIPCAAQGQFSRHVREYSQSMAPYVASPQQIVDKMLQAASLKTGDTIYDLGCGDGRVLITAAQKYGVKAVGVELSETLAKSTQERVKRLSLQDQIQIIHGNLMDVNLSSADAVFIYLETGSNDRVRPNLEKFLKPGARVVSHDFAVRGWRPQRIEKIEIYNRPHTIYVYEMPPVRN
ncbi:MAG TPA: class I SAM-dependent methyltransferase [Bryobacteraceae bacterium]|nr:class I SAM-dependent methyltransferase [Bryobacteraceae bacterium]